MLDDQLAYWHDNLSGASTSVELPLDRPRTSRPSYRGSAQSRLLRPELVNALDGFGKEHGLTPFMIMLGALNILLAGIITHDVALREERALVPTNLVAPSLRVSVAHPIDEVLALLSSEPAIDQKAAVAARTVAD